MLFLFILWFHALPFPILVGESSLAIFFSILGNWVTANEKTVQPNS